MNVIVCKLHTGKKGKMIWLNLKHISYSFWMLPVYLLLNFRRLLQDRQWYLVLYWWRLSSELTCSDQAAVWRGLEVTKCPGCRSLPAWWWFLLLWHVSYNEMSDSILKRSFLPPFFPLILEERKINSEGGDYGEDLIFSYVAAYLEFYRQLGFAF